jgi:hypothetical protein
MGTHQKNKNNSRIKIATTNKIIKRARLDVLQTLIVDDIIDL